MGRPTQTAIERRKLLARLFPEGVPVLWCPLITHYDRDGAIDAARMAAHLACLSGNVKGYLICGSTGDGWDLRESEVRTLLNLAIEHAARLKLHLLIGVLRVEARESIDAIVGMTEWLRGRTGSGDVLTGMAAGGVCGFTVCPPRGADLLQRQLGEALGSILETGLPTALYQLPQVTLNEAQPDLIADLARQFSNFILFKDSSGADHVAVSGKKTENVFLVRGAEGDYVRWLNVVKGPYDGFLLSSANCLAHELAQLISELRERRLKSARERSDRLTSCIHEVFGIVTGLPDGNAFTNAGKAMDHFFAYGPGAANAEPPRLHAGSRLPVDVIRATGDALSNHGFMPAPGYLE